MTADRQKFSEWLAEYGRGSLDDKLTAALSDVAHEVSMLDKSGTITLKLKLNAKAGGVVVEPDIAAAPPKSKSGEFFYVQPSGALSRRDPAQPQIHDTDPANPKKTDLEKDDLK